MDTKDEGPKGLIKKSFFVSFSAHLLLLGSLWFVLQSDSAEKASGSEGMGEHIYVSLVSGPANRTSELGEKSLRKAIFTAGIQSQNRRQRSGLFGSTQNRRSVVGDFGTISRTSKSPSAGFSRHGSSRLLSNEPSSLTPSSVASIHEGGENGSSDILRQIRIKIERAKFYPLTARRSHMEGSPLVEFKIKQDGSLEYVVLKQSSGFGLLDEAALNTVKQAKPFPFYPEPIALNIHYTLR